jgi:ERCC4-related helicase
MLALYKKSKLSTREIRSTGFCNSSNNIRVVLRRMTAFLCLLYIRRRQQELRDSSGPRVREFSSLSKSSPEFEIVMLISAGFRVAGIHGDLSQEQRTRSLEAFKNGNTPILVATDVAARGLDIPAVKLVVRIIHSLSSHSPTCFIMYAPFPPDVSSNSEIYSVSFSKFSTLGEH